MRVIFTCGGTAGHVNPALAVAQVFAREHPDCEILFVGAERGMEIRLVEQAGFPIRTVNVSTFERAWGWRFLKHNVKSAFKVPASRRQATAILKEHCAKYVAKYALPTEYYFRDALPKTLVGKVAYRVLEEEMAAQQN